MKFFLARGVSIDSSLLLRSNDQKALGIRPMRAPITSNDIVPCEGTEGIIELCNKLRQRLNLSADINSRHYLRHLNFEIVAAAGEDGGRVRLRILSDSLSTALVELFGKDVTIQMEIFNLYIQCQGISSRAQTVVKISSGEMKVRNYGAYACEDMISFSGLNIINDQMFRGELTVTVTVGEELFSPGAGLETTDKLQAYKKMLLEGIRSDVVIIPVNGEMLKAHTNVLAAHSAVFNAMFESDMQEAKTHTLEMRDMSEEGVRAMLAYMYYRDYEEPNAKSVVAFEMFHAGHKYNIPVLEADMKKLLLTKAEEWYEVDVAMKLYLLAKKLPEDGEGLKKKAVRVLKKNSDNLNESSTFVALFQEDVEAAMELCKSLAA